jgi:RHS repeat-associated protein
MRLRSAILQVGFREYDPDVGAFLEDDPATALASLSTPASFQYAAQNPVDLVDPKGLWTIDPTSCSLEQKLDIVNAMNLALVMLWRCNMGCTVGNMFDKPNWIHVLLNAEWSCDGNPDAQPGKDAEGYSVTRWPCYYRTNRHVFLTPSAFTYQNKCLFAKLLAHEASHLPAVCSDEGWARAKSDQCFQCEPWRGK